MGWGSVQWMKSRAAIAAIGLIPATVILASACSSGAGLGNKAGPVDQPVVLRMADLNAGTDLRGTPEIQYFVQRVSDLSRGKMSVKVAYSVGGLAMNAEQQVVKDVAAGSFDLGFAGTSVFDTLGVPSFQALSAPMLIDSYPLENAVIRSSLPAKMMAGLAKLDVTGLAVLGDEMRRPVGVRQPILSLADWRGITFGTYQSKTEDAAVRALGAKPGPGFATARDQALASGALQGFDLNLVYYHQLVQGTRCALHHGQRQPVAQDGRPVRQPRPARQALCFPAPARDSGGGRRGGPLDRPIPGRRPGRSRHMPVGRTVR